MSPRFLQEDINSQSRMAIYCHRKHAARGSSHAPLTVSSTRPSEVLRAEHPVPHRPGLTAARNAHAQVHALQIVMKTSKYACEGASASLSRAMVLPWRAASRQPCESDQSELLSAPAALLQKSGTCLCDRHVVQQTRKLAHCAWHEFMKSKFVLDITTMLSLSGVAP